MEIYGDYITSIKRAFEEIDKNYDKYEALVIGGSHNPKDIEFLLGEIRKARERKTPFYGECWGYQLAAIEYAKNVLGIKDATSEEWGKGTFVVKKRKDGLNVGLRNGESYWNNYEVDLPDWKIPNNFFIAQYHASYQSSIFNKHKLIKDFIKYARMAMQNSK
jgi:CTP synthase